MKVSAKNTLLSCEHASHRIPAAHRYLFRNASDVLASHRGWDPGALECATRLSKKLNLPLLKGSCSRLLIDLNRSLHHRQVFSDYTRLLPKAVRQTIIEDIYLPYRDQLRQTIAANITKRGFVLHLSIHSFAPVLNGSLRDADIGLLYDPHRTHEKNIAARLQLHLITLDPTLKIRRNYPYRGVADGATTQCRREFSGRVYAGVEIEINQKYPLGGDHNRWRQLQDHIILAVNNIFQTT
ncbi:MAG: N-formylglutamate amidohydrolase [Gammaproteobacteria bacterium]|nr:N-formylglutamate amidohydrolase [Gammaproteobacteria bacterium]